MSEDRDHTLRQRRRLLAADLDGRPDERAVKCRKTKGRGVSSRLLLDRTTGTRTRATAVSRFRRAGESDLSHVGKQVVGTVCGENKKSRVGGYERVRLI